MHRLPHAGTGLHFRSHRQILNLLSVQRHMAGIAWDREMSPRQWVFGLLMRRHGECRGAEPLQIVTIIACRPRWSISELTEMMIHMAVGARRESRRNLGDTTRMTGFALDLLVGSNQWVSGSVMIEALHVD